jgi:hypothetical protein
MLNQTFFDFDFLQLFKFLNFKKMLSAKKPTIFNPVKAHRIFFLA